MVWLGTQCLLGMLMRVQENLKKYHGCVGCDPPLYFSYSRSHRLISSDFQSPCQIRSWRFSEQAGIQVKSTTCIIGLVFMNTSLQALCDSEARSPLGPRSLTKESKFLTRRTIIEGSKWLSAKPTDSLSRRPNHLETGNPMWIIWGGLLLSKALWRKKKLEASVGWEERRVAISRLRNECVKRAPAGPGQRLCRTPSLALEWSSQSPVAKELARPT